MISNTLFSIVVVYLVWSNMKIKISVEGMNVNIVLNKEQINEFDLKWRSIGEESTLENFIVNDISDLVKNEIDNGLYGLFNY